MAFAYSIKDQHGLYFLTFTVNSWIDVFSRKAYADIIVESLRYCQKEKGLQLYGWVIMTNHLHLIAGCTAPEGMSAFIRDFKKYTSKKIVAAIEHNPQESRKSWLLHLLKGNSGFEFWQADNHAEAIISKKFFEQKLKYLHLNPVRAGYVHFIEDWVMSSASSKVLELRGWMD